jgi:hypothetical protein
MNLITITKAPRLAVGGMKSHRGMEGMTLDVNLYLDGKLVGYGIDDGNGGGMYFNWEGYSPKLTPEESGRRARANEDAVEQYIVSLNLPPDVINNIGPEPFEMKQDLEHLINEVVDNWQEDKAQRAQFSRTAKGNVIFRMPGEAADKFRTVPLKNKSGHAFSVEQIKEFINKKYLGAIFVETFEQFSGKAA